MPHHLYSTFIRLPMLFRIFLMTVFVIFIFGFIVYLLEPETFPTLFDAIWWAVVTASTVGYGDFVPHTVLGKIAGIILILLGASFVSLYFVTLAKTAITIQENVLEGKAIFKRKGQLIIIGWNERSREIIHASNMSKYEQDIILIDETLESNPFNPKQVHFIKGRSTNDETLIKAGIAEAEKVVITADQHKDELHADMNSILTLLAIKGLNMNAHCIVEILTTEQVENAKRAGANEIIQTNLLTSFVVMNSLISQISSHSALELLEHLTKSNMSFYFPHVYSGREFAEVSSELIKEGNLLLGVKRGDDIVVNPPHSFLIQTNDQLLTITSPC